MSLREHAGVPVDHIDRGAVERAAERVRIELGPEPLDAAVAAGRSLTLPALLDLARQPHPAEHPSAREPR
jgi:hypothetical protein